MGMGVKGVVRVFGCRRRARHRLASMVSQGERKKDRAKHATSTNTRHGMHIQRDEQNRVGRGTEQRTNERANRAKKEPNAPRWLGPSRTARPGSKKYRYMYPRACVWTESERRTEKGERPERGVGTGETHDVPHAPQTALGVVAQGDPMGRVVDARGRVIKHVRHGGDKGQCHPEHGYRRDDSRRRRRRSHPVVIEIRQQPHHEEGRERCHLQVFVFLWYGMGRAAAKKMATRSAAEGRTATLNRDKELKKTLYAPTASAIAHVSPM